MQPLQVETIDAVLASAIPFIVLVLAIANVATRYLAHRRHVRQADERGADGIERYSAHTATTIALVLASFYYILVELDTGVIVATFALTLFLADFFEYEARLVEARTDRRLEPPKAAIGASLLLLVYAVYVVLVGVLGPFWNSVI